MLHHGLDNRENDRLVWLDEKVSHVLLVLLPTFNLVFD